MSFIKKHKGLTIFLVIMILIIAGIAYLVNQAQKASAQLMETMNSADVGTVEVRTIRDVVAAVGSVQSSTVENVMAEVSAVKVLSVNVKEGDAVKAGDIICVMDSTDLEASLENAKNGLDATQTSNSLSVNSANRQLTGVLTEQQISADRFETQIADAKAALEKAQKQADSLLKVYTDARSAREDLANKKTQNETNIAAYNKKIEELTAAINGWSGDADSEELASLQVSLEQHQAAVAEFNALAVTLETQYASAAAAEQAAGDTYNAYADSTLKAAQNAYDQVMQSSEDAARNYANSVINAKDSVTSTKLNTESSLTTASQQVEQLQKQVNACTVVAPADGIVTAVNVKAGDVYAGAPVATVEDLSSFEVICYIDEYDIGKVKVGQKAVIKTNGTGDTMLDGTVTYVATHATPGTADVSYKVLISIDSKNEDLRLDMTAKISIIRDEAVDTLTVPYDAIQTDDDNKSYVEVPTGEKDQFGADVTEKVYVETGLESNYYIQIISSQLKEGDEILIPKKSNAMDDLMEMLYGEGGIYAY